MRLEIWAIIILAVVVLILLYSNNDKKEQIKGINRRNDSERQKLNNEIEELRQSVISGRFNHTNNPSNVGTLKAEIIRRKTEQENRYNEITQRYMKLLRCYMLERQTTQINAIAEIEDSISHDFILITKGNKPATDYIASAMADYYTAGIKSSEKMLLALGQKYRSTKIADLREESKKLIEKVKKSQYVYEFILSRILLEYPEIEYEKILSKYNIDDSFVPSFSLDNDIKTIENLNNTIAELKRKVNNLKYQNDLLNKQSEKNKQQIDEFLQYKDIRWTLLYNSIADYQKKYTSNLKAIPYMSRIISDIMTIDIDKLTWSLSWGNNQERKKKVASLNSLKKEKQEEIEKLKWAEYQLAYLLELYPALQDVIDTEFKELSLSYDEITDYDPVKKYMEKEEWEKLSESERNQLALDRYIDSRKKSNWQIGRDYELYCGYCYEKKGYTVDYYGSYNGLEDLGRDLIIKQDNETRIVQCKYWSQNKKIHENHIMQLYGSVVEYNIENNTTASGVLLTNTLLSEKAKEFAKVLGIAYKEKMPIGDFPRIKCNIGIGENGEKTKIYHLPFDQQYDATKIDSKAEFMAMTVAEAEAAGFRRAYKWFGNNS